MPRFDEEELARFQTRVDHIHALIDAHQTDLQPAMDGYLTMMQQTTRPLGSMQAAARMAPKAFADAALDQIVGGIARAEIATGVTPFSDAELLEHIRGGFEQETMAMAIYERGGQRSM